MVSKGDAEDDKASSHGTSLLSTVKREQRRRAVSRQSGDRLFTRCVSTGYDLRLGKEIPRQRTDDFTIIVLDEDQCVCNEVAN